MIVKFDEYRSVLCLHGNLPDHKFFQKIQLPIIAADGAANSLTAMGITPHMIIGDLDSVRQDLLVDGKFIKLGDQNSSDFEKALNYLGDNSLLPSIILGINGGYMDHILNNINIFARTNSIFLGENMVGLMLRGTHVFNLEIGTKLSLFGIPKCLITTKGLRWNLGMAELAFPGFNSCFNRTTLGNIHIHIAHGTALLIVYTSTIVDAGLSLDDDSPG
ncbi:MAG: thiamine diphosphokinase [Puniceicoccales bacterium]|jgi:thiamine pyrophosphokinase|nr:thiamine diphosphokinase [Puniceicoccales bacterium]